VSRRRAWARVLLLAAAVAVLWGMRRTTPNYNRLVAPIETGGDVGAFVRGRTVAARVDRVMLARTVRLHRFDGARTFDTSGVWLVVRATATSVEGPATMADAVVETAGGVRYQQTERLAGATDLLSSKTLQPEVPTEGELVFELPRDALTGAELLLAERRFGLGMLDSRLRIPLGLDAARVARQLAALPDRHDLGRRR
jgi:hypothetical protein